MSWPTDLEITLNQKGMGSSLCPMFFFNGPHYACKFAPSKLSVVSFEHSNGDSWDGTSRSTGSRQPVCEQPMLHANSIELSLPLSCMHSWHSSSQQVCQCCLITCCYHGHCHILSFDHNQLRLCYCLISSGIFDVSHILTCWTHQAELLFLF